MEPSEFVITSLILQLVAEGRETSTFLGGNSAACFHVLRYINDTIGDYSVAHRKKLIKSSVESIDVKLGSLLPPDCQFIQSTLKSLLFESIDKFMDYASKIEDIFRSPSCFDPNGVICPNCISKTSHLGIFVRYCCAELDAMLFEETCEFYDALIAFVNRLLSKTSRAEGVQLPAATHSIGWGDMNPIEYDIHEFFDFGGHPPPMSTPSSTGIGVGPGIAGGSLIFPEIPGSSEGSDPAAETSQDISSLPSFHSVTAANSNLKLLQLTELIASASSRHQSSMVSLATSWARNGNHELAMIAVDEAMKTAHHRNDHVTVAHCLYLLFHIISLQAVDIVGELSSFHDVLDRFERTNKLKESILLKCIEQSAASALPVLSAHSVILLAQLRGSAVLASCEAAVSLSQALAVSNNQSLSLSQRQLFSTSTSAVSNFDNYLEGIKKDLKSFYANRSKTDHRQRTVFDYSTGVAVNISKLGHSRWSSSHIWALLSVSTLALPHIVDLFSKGKYDELANIMPSKSIGVGPAAAAAAAAAAANNSNNMAKSMLLDISLVDHMQISLKLALVSVDFWLRVGNVYLAKMQCQRTFAILASDFAKFCNSSTEKHSLNENTATRILLIEEIVCLGCKYCETAIELDCPLANEFRINPQQPQQNRDTPPRAFQCALDVLETLDFLNGKCVEGTNDENSSLTESDEPQLPYSLLAQHLIDTWRAIVHIRIEMYNSNRVRALQLAQDLLAALPIPSTPAASHHTTKYDIQTETTVDVKLLLAAILSHFHLRDSIALLQLVCRDALTCHGELSSGSISSTACFSSSSTYLLPHFAIYSLMRKVVLARAFSCALRLRLHYLQQQGSMATSVLQRSKSEFSNKYDVILQTEQSEIGKDLLYCCEMASECALLSIDNDLTVLFELE